MKQRESSDVVKNRILDVATRLFARHGVDGVSIRMIAAEAGINHALIIRYFGSKDALVTEILRQKVSALSGAYPVIPRQVPEKTLEKIQEIFLNALKTDETTMRLIVRASLDGLAPECYVDGMNERPAALIARWMEFHQAGRDLPDPKLVSLVVTGALFSLVTIAPWLMTAVNLPPEDFEKREKEIVDVVIWMLARAIGLPGDGQANINI